MDPLLTTTIIASFIGSIVHLFPGALTKLVSKTLFSIKGLRVTPQRIVGLIGSVGAAIIIYTMFIA